MFSHYRPPKETLPEVFMSSYKPVVPFSEVPFLSFSVEIMCQLADDLFEEEGKVNN